MFKYSPHFLPNKIFLFGCGGTGSRIMPGLAQLVRSLLNKNNPLSPFLDLRILCCDGDVVEEKNLLRQHFAPQDVGKNKAAVLAARYSSAFDVSIHPCTTFFGEENRAREEFLGYPGEPFSNFSIIILAVDSAKARKKILQRFLSHAFSTPLYDPRNFFIIDVGNEDNFGQIRYSHMAMAEKVRLPEDVKGFPKLVPLTLDIPFIPFDGDYYIKLGGSAQELSCADLPQTLAVNSQAASLVITACQNFLLRKPFHNSGVRFNLDGGFSSEKLDRHWASSFLHRNIDPAYYPSTGFENIPVEEIVMVRDLVRSLYACAHKLPLLALLENLRASCGAFYKERGLKILNDGELAPIVSPVLTPISQVESSPQKDPPPKKSKKNTLLPRPPLDVTAALPVTPPPLVRI